MLSHFGKPLKVVAEWLVKRFSKNNFYIPTQLDQIGSLLATLNCEQIRVQWRHYSCKYYNIILFIIRVLAFGCLNYQILLIKRQSKILRLMSWTITIELYKNWNATSGRIFVAGSGSSSQYFFTHGRQAAEFWAEHGLKKPVNKLSISLLVLWDVEQVYIRLL